MFGTSVVAEDWRCGLGRSQSIIIISLDIPSCGSKYPADLEGRQLQEYTLRFARDVFKAMGRLLV